MAYENCLVEFFPHSLFLLQFQKKMAAFCSKCGALTRDDGTVAGGEDNCRRRDPPENHNFVPQQGMVLYYYYLLTKHSPTIVLVAVVQDIFVLKDLLEVKRVSIPFVVMAPLTMW